MGAVTIITNNVPRDIIEPYELTPDEQAEFDYYKWGDDTSDVETTFFRYKGELYDMGDFMVTPPMSLIKEWDGYKNDTFFSGMLVRHPREGDMIDMEHVIVGRYYT